MKSDERMVHMRENQYKSLLETTLNTRDLGGYTTNIPGVQTQLDRVYRSDIQDKPSQKDIEFLEKKRINTIIDMRGKEEVEKKHSGFAALKEFKYYHFPIEEGSGIPESVAAVSESYFKIAHAKNISKVFMVIAAADEGVMFNCSAGKDRTGVVSALLLLLCGVSREDIVSDYVITKECNKERFKLIRKNLPDIDMNIVIPRESYMNDFLNMLYERYESVDDYFDVIGIDVSARDVIKKKMCGV